MVPVVLNWVSPQMNLRMKSFRMHLSKKEICGNSYFQWIHEAWFGVVRDFGNKLSV